MIALRRGGERHYDRSSKREVWLTFNRQDPTDPLADGFGALEILNETRLSPGAGVPRHPLQDAEIITYVRAGALAFEDSRGQSGVIPAGEFQCVSAGRALRYRDTNASRSDAAHILQILLYPTQMELEPSREQKRFSTAQRRGVLCLVASPDGRGQSLRIRQDTLIYSSLLDPGQHVVHQLSPARRAWLHVVEGEAALGEDVLTTGDGAGIQAERAVSVTAREVSEILLLDLGERTTRSDQRGRLGNATGGSR